MTLEWKIPPSEAECDHGQYAVGVVDSRALCYYKTTGGEWIVLGGMDIVECDRLLAIARARDIGNQHYERVEAIMNECVDVFMEKMK